MKSAVIKAALRTDERLAGVSVLACLMHAYGHTACDNYGRLKGTASWWAVNVVPGRATVAECDAALKELIETKALEPYQVDGVPYVLLPDWFETQTFQNGFVLRAVCPNPYTCEVEGPAYWSAVRDQLGMRKRGTRLKLKSPEINLSETGNGDLNLADPDPKLSDTDLMLNQVVVVEEEEGSYQSSNPGTTTTTDANLRTDDLKLVEPVIPYWEGHDDPMVVFMGMVIASVPKYRNASRPANLKRVIDLLARIREEAPDDVAVRDLLTGWQDFHQADTGGKYGKNDPIASIREQIAFKRPRWATMRKRMEEQAKRDSDASGRQIQRVAPRGETAQDELARITRRGSAG